MLWEDWQRVEGIGQDILDCNSVSGAVLFGSWNER